MHRSIVEISLLCFFLTACNVDRSDEGGAGNKIAPTSAAAAPQADPFAANDAVPGQTSEPAADSSPRPVMQLQVVLDRFGFTPGVVDGREGLSTRNAIMGFQEANGMAVTGKLDEPTTRALAGWNSIPATRMVTIPADFAAGSFTRLPGKPDEQSKLPALGYESLDEKLAERFHTTIDTLRMLNPEPGGDARGVTLAAATSSPSDSADTAAPVTAYFRAGQSIRVPNVGADRIDPAVLEDAKWLDTLRMLGVSSTQPRAERIVVSKSKGTLKAYDKTDRLIGMYTATMGSRRDPLPLGKWKVNGVAHNPNFHYNPDLFWDVSDKRDAELLPPGPNGPVGVVWIDLSKAHYGIHGTPAPETIGRAQSHGCVRLTNWDAARLAQMVTAGTSVLFEA